MMEYKIRKLHALAAVLTIVLPFAASGQTASVTLSPAASPTAGQPGITAINLTGSGFPTGTIQPTAVIVSMTPSAGGTAVTTASTAVTTIAGSTRRVTFTVPASISVAAPTAYSVSISGSTTANATFASGNTAALTVNPAAQILSATPPAGKPGQTLSVTITGAYTNFVQGSTVASFGAGIAVGGAAEGAAGPVTVSSATTAVAQIVIDAAAATGLRAISVSTGAQTATLASGFSVSATGPTITSFAPQSGTVGTIVTLNGSNFGSAPQVSMAGVNATPVSAPLQSLTAASVSIVIPTGAATGPITVTSSGLSASTASSFTLNPSSTFTISAAPASANLIQGQTVAYAVQLSSASGFNQLAPLAVSGLPAGVTASFKPSSITAGQTSVLTLSAPAGQALSTSTLTVSASATVDGISITQAATASLGITAPTTTFMGRTVVADSLETPLAGVTVTMLGLDGAGNKTGCTGNTSSDAAGNFALTNLAANCIGPQLVGFGGLSVTSPPGTYAGVNLVFTLVSGKVVVSPVLVHLPKIDNAETYSVQQNAATDQTHVFTTIPGLTVTVYAHTTFTMADGTQPNPFPLAAIQVAVDRLPDIMPVTNAGVVPFIVAFQPANTTASQEVAVYYPNTLNNPPGTNMPLMTLNPTLGRMVPYGTGTVSADGTQIIPDIDPSTGALQHRFGIVHFDWHGWLVKAAAGISAYICGKVPGLYKIPACAAAVGLAALAAEPIELASGLHVMTPTDLSVQGTRGGISLQRIYRSVANYDGSFGTGMELQYTWQLDTPTPASSAIVNLVAPDGERFPFSLQSDGTLRNNTIPGFEGIVMQPNSGQATELRFANGTVYIFKGLGNLSALTAITDRNGNTTTITVVSLGPVLRVTQITDPVGRSITLTYDSNRHATSASDPLGRTVSYAYNPTGTLATFTDAAGGMTEFQYDSQNRMISIIDPRGVKTFQDTFDANGRVIKQAVADGGVFEFSYTLLNALVPTSSVLATTVTDPLGEQTTYRFNPQGFVTDVTDAIGQTKSFTLAAGTNETLAVTGPAQCGVCGPAGQGSRSYTYDASGNILSVTDAVGNTTYFTYELDFNQLTSVTDPLTNKSTYGYDGAGNLTNYTDQNGHTTKYVYGSSGLLTNVIDPSGNMTYLVYDGAANPVSVTDPLGNLTTAAYDAVSRPTSTTDSVGRITRIAFDALDRVTSVRDGRGSTTQFVYDPVGNLLKVTDPRGSVTSFTYDAVNHWITRTSATGKTQTNQYDLDGNIVQATDRRGQTNSFQYDLLNRLVKELYQDGANVTRTYDPYSRLLTATDSVSGTFKFTYDLNGNLAAQSQPTGSISYQIDRLGRIAARQVTGLAAVTYSYDPAGNLLAASMPGAGVFYSYDARSLPVSTSRTNGVVSNYTFDALGQVLSIVNVSGALLLNSQSYGYDSAGNLNDAVNDFSQPLITQAGASSFDPANELQSNGSTVYQNDSNGNRLSETGPKGTVSYSWDSRNRLSSITDSAGNITSLIYDVNRNLIEMTKSGGPASTQMFIVDSLSNVAALTDSYGLPASVLTGTSIDSHLAAMDSSGNVTFGIGDSLGSTVGLTSSSGAILAKLEYEPFGQTTGTAVTSYPFTFTGRVPVSGNIVYFRNRFYDTAVGRFLSEDPIDFLGGDSNLYRYADNNPVSDNDPDGTKPYKKKGRMPSTGKQAKQKAARKKPQGMSWSPGDDTGGTNNDPTNTTIINNPTTIINNPTTINNNNNCDGAIICIQVNVNQGNSK